MQPQHEWSANWGENKSSGWGYIQTRIIAEVLGQEPSNSVRFAKAKQGGPVCLQTPVESQDLDIDLMLHYGYSNYLPDSDADFMEQGFTKKLVDSTI